MTSGEFDLRHRALVAASRRRADPLELDERAHALLDMLPSAQRRAGPVRPATVAVHRRLVSAACEALTEGEFALGVDEVARRVHCSPHHLSRVFRRVTGHSLSFYRNQLRVRAVLEDLQQGVTSLRELAATYGFADQTHMTRVVRRHLGQTPGRLARILAPV